jgi:Dolichyl-phosphate-mannose-protein mannosyltransferase
MCICSKSGRLTLETKMDNASQGNGAELVRQPLPMFVVLGLILLVGIALRVRVFQDNPGLFDDDGRLGVNILSRSQSDLILKPLDYSQAAPVMYLLLTKQLVQWFGTDEWVFRLPALLASVLALGLYVLLARQVLDPWGQGFALALMALNWRLAEYSGRVKQYSGDVLMTVILTSLGIWALRRRRCHAWLMIIGAIMVLWSQPSVFVLAGIGLTLIGTAAADRRYRDALGWAAVSSIWFLVFLMCYLLVYRHSTNNTVLLSFWADQFAPFPPRSLEQFKWYYDTFIGLFAMPVGLSFGGLGAVGFLFGAYLLLTRGQGRLLILLVSPLILTLLASALKKYPFGERLMLFSCPLLTTMVAIGIAGITQGSSGRGGVLRGLIAILMLIYPIYMSVKTLKAPSVPHDIKPAMAYIGDHWHDGDVIHVNFWAKPLVDFYKMLDYRGLKDKPYFMGTDPGEQFALNELVSTFGKDFDQLKGKRRVWVIFIKQVHGEETVSTSLLDHRGVRIDEFRGRGSTAYLYDLSGHQLERSSTGSDPINGFK